MKPGRVCRKPVARIVQLVAIKAVFVFSLSSSPGNTAEPQLLPTESGARCVLFLGHEGPRFIQLHIRSDSQLLLRRWKDAIAGLFDRLDADGNGILHGKETHHWESARRVIGYLINRKPTGYEFDNVVPRFSEGPVSRASFVEALGDLYSHTLLIHTIGQAASSDSVVFKRLDVNGDGKLARAELHLNGALRRLDFNDDELLSRLEVDLAAPIPMEQTDIVFLDVTSPPQQAAAVGALLARYDGRAGKSPDDTIDESEVDSTSETFEDFDMNRDERLNEAELCRWLQQPPITESLVLRFGQTRLAAVERWTREDLEKEARRGGRESSTARFAATLRGILVSPFSRRRSEFSFAVGSERLRFTADTTGALQLDLGMSEQFGFLIADVDNNSYLDRSEFEDGRLRLGPFDVLDSDADGKLFGKELDHFIEQYADLADSVCHITIQDGERHLFSTLDLDGDKLITQREFQSCWTTLAKWDQNGDAQIAFDEIPHTWNLTFGRDPHRPGQALGEVAVQTELEEAKAVEAPTWFKGMDRNRDGDISGREFLGPRSDFVKLDADGDGLISPDEAVGDD